MTDADQQLPAAASPPPARPKAADRFKDIFGCCCLAPLVLGLVLAAAAFAAVIIFQDAITQLGIDLVNAVFDAIKERIKSFL